MKEAREILWVLMDPQSLPTPPPPPANNRARVSLPPRARGDRLAGKGPQSPASEGRKAALKSLAEGLTHSCFTSCGSQKEALGLQLWRKAGTAPQNHCSPGDSPEASGEKVLGTPGPGAVGDQVSMLSLLLAGCVTLGKSAILSGREAQPL